MAFICDIKSNRSNLHYPFTWLEWMIDLWPTRYKKPRLLSWIGVVFTELNDMYLQFLNKRCEELFLASADGTTIKLEKILNMLFNNNGTEIYITNFLLEIDTLTAFKRGEDTGTIENFVYNRGEDPVASGGTQPYVFTKNEVQLSTNFVINIPQSLASVIDLGALKVLVDKYRFAYVTYKIEFY
jgi:hypothetical protein